MPPCKQISVFIFTRTHEYPPIWGPLQQIFMDSLADEKEIGLEVEFKRGRFILHEIKRSVGKVREYRKNAVENVIQFANSFSKLSLAR